MKIEKNYRGKIEKSNRRLDLVNMWIANVDSKSSFVLTVYSIIISIIFTSEYGLKMFEILTYKSCLIVNNKSISSFCYVIMVIIFFVSIIFTFYYIFQTLKGRIDINVYKKNGLKTDSNIFFGSIVEKEYLEYKEATNTEGDEFYLNDINSQIYINSNIAKLKFENYNSSIFWLILSFATLFLSMFFK